MYMRGSVMGRRVHAVVMLWPRLPSFNLQKFAKLDGTNFSNNIFVSHRAIFMLPNLAY